MERQPGLGRFFPVILFASAASAAEPVWIKASTANFELYTNYNEKQAVEIVRHFEEIRQFFADATGSKKAAASRARLVAFRSAKDFQPYAPNEFAAAFYLSSGDRDYIVMREARQDVYRIAVHEYAHLVIKYTGMQVPVWLNEGLAELYSTLRRDGKRTLLGEPIPGHLYNLQRSAWLPIDALLAVDHQSPSYNEKDRAGIFYSQSWALTHMLNLDPDYRGKFGVLLSHLERGRVDAASLEQTYGRTAKAIQDDLKNYVNGTRFNAAAFDQKLAVSKIEPQIEAADEVERGMLFSTLLQHRDPSGSLTRLTALAAQYPNRPEPAEALGYLLWRQGDVTSAIDRMLAAVAAGSTNAKLHFDVAMLGQMKGRPDEEVARLLKKATDLQPEYKDAYIRLAAVHMRLKAYAQAVVALQQVKKIEPKDAVWYFRTLAYANHQIQRKEEAVKNAELYLKYASEQRDIDDAGRLLKFVKGEREFVQSDGRPAMPHAVSPGEVIERLVPAGPELKAVEGALTDVVCAKTNATLKVESTRRGVLAFLIDDPGKVVIRGTGEMQFEFTCGPQKRTPVVLRFEERTNLPAGVAGLVRELDFEGK